MRVKGFFDFSHEVLERITPAHAGKRSQWKINKVEEEDHPRTCGEKNVKMLKSLWKLGSPPHMRGKGTVLSEMMTSHRITPAHAGKRTRNKAVGGAK